MAESRFQQSHFKAPWRVIVMLLTPVLAVAALFYSAVSENDRIYEPAPVSTAHAIFGHECWRCHSENGLTTDWRAAFNEGAAIVPDKACAVCHDGPPHHEEHKQHSPTACADCHHEHRGRKQLVAVADQHCIACHADLNATQRTQATFASEIHSFADHPEFALLDKQQNATIGGEHRFDGLVEMLDGQRRDAAKIRLNHAVHLKPGGILGLDGKKQRLDCQSCHTPDAAGYMQPINNEQHCAECHRDKLNFDSQRFADAPVPHGDAEAARGVIRQRYVDYFLKHPKLYDDTMPPGDNSAEEKPEQQDSAESLDRTIPGKPPRLSSRGWTWVNEQIEQADRILFQQAQDGCRYCHTQVESDESAWHVEPPRIPYRWYPYARFRHDSHRLLSCTECHSQAQSSRETGDILLPAITNCRSCHTKNPARPAASEARSHCAECHDYHQHHGENFDGPLSLDLQVVEPDYVRQPPVGTTGDR